MLETPHGCTIGKGVTFRALPIWAKHNGHVKEPLSCILTHPARPFAHSNLDKEEETWNGILDPVDSLGMRHSAALAQQLRLCAKAKALPEGMRVHTHIITIAQEQNIVTGNFLVQMYGKCGALEDALAVFAKMSRQNLFSWAIMIGEYTQNQEAKEALRFFHQMLLQGIIPDKVTFISVLSACAKEQALMEGRLVHTQILDHGFKSDVFLGTALVNMYSKCGRLQDSQKAFDEMRERNVVSWNVLIAAYVDHDQSNRALHHFQQLQLEGFIPDRATFVTMLPVCRRLVDGQQMHVHITGTELESEVAVGTALITMYGKFGNIEDALRTFRTMPERNLVSWNSIIGACAHNHQGKLTMQLFRQLQLDNMLPDKATFISMLGVCDSQAALMDGKQIHASILVSECESCATVKTALLKMYSNCSSVENAWKVFVEMPERNLISWNSIIAAYVQHGQRIKFLQLFGKMQLEGVIPDKVTFTTILSGCASQTALTEGMHMHVCITGSDLELDIGNALLNMYGKCGNVHETWAIFNSMHERSVASWNAVIAVCTQKEQGDRFFQLLEQMQLEAVIPDEITFVTLFSACASTALLAKGRQMHASIVGTAMESNIVVRNAIIHMYGKCGCLKHAEMMFEKMPERSVVTWNAMIGAYAQHGQHVDAIKILQQMQVQGEAPDVVTFFSILSACSHGGLVEEGFQWFHSMRRDHHLTPALEHFNCMISLLGRAGQLEEGEKLMYEMPLAPTAISWMALLGSCRTHLDGDRGRRAAEPVFKLEPGNAAPYVSLANTYAAVGKFEDAARMIN